MRNKDFSDILKKRIYFFIIKLIKFIERLPQQNEVCIVIKRQLLRSGTSIGANYVEATAGSSEKDFTNFLNHALKSANESKFWLCLLRDTNKGDREQIQNLLLELKEISSILAQSIKTLRAKQ